MTSYKKLFAYEGWANHEAAEALLRVPSPSSRILRIMAHIIGASWLWYSRVVGQPSPIPVWPELRPDELPSGIDAVQRVWEKLLQTLTPEQLNKPIHYVNTKGEPWTSTVEEILTHLFMHSAYHRGQLAVLLRLDNHEPAYTDYIHAARQKLI
jgi:uncharacterized damage-inducible protein DinB